MKLHKPSVAGSTSVGVEISSGAVRAAELYKTRHGLALRRYAEVPLLQGCVVDGEVKDPAAVGAALRRLWSEGKFTTHKVVLSASSQRVFVRQATVPAMPASEFASALEFQAGELIPLPVNQAIIDFAILEKETPQRQGSMQVLLGAAHRDVVTSQLAALDQASLKPIAVDASPLSAMRAAGPAIDDRAFAVVQRAEGQTVMAVRQAGALRFSRILSGRPLDSGARQLDRPDTEQPLPFGVPPMERGTNGSAAGGVRLHDPETEVLPTDASLTVNEIASSLSYFASQLASGQLDQVVYAGDVDPAAGEELAQRLGCRVRALDVLCMCDVSGLDEGTRRAAATRGLLVLGAAQWPFDPTGRLSLVSRGAATAAMRQRRVALAVAGAAALVVVLGAVTYHEHHEAQSTREHAATITASNDQLQAQVSGLSQLSTDVAAIHARVGTLHSLETGDISWPGLLSEIAAAMPPQASLTNLTFSSDTPTTTSTDPSSSAGIGTLSVTVQAKGNQSQVADWIRSLRGVKGLSDVWVSSSSASKRTVTFTSTATVTSAVPMVHRAATGSGS